MELTLTKGFALLLAAAVLGTSVWIFIRGGRFRAVEEAAYAGSSRPWWFKLGLVAFAAAYLVALAGFIGASERTWAGWLLMVVIPVGAALKGALVILSEKGRAKVVAIEGDRAWRTIALSRALLVPLFLVLAYYA
jgi:hypothetical protein